MTYIRQTQVLAQYLYFFVFIFAFILLCNYIINRKMPATHIVMSFEKLLLPQTSRAQKVILMVSIPNKISKLKAQSQVKSHKVKFYGENICLPYGTRDLQIIIIEQKLHSNENAKIRISVPNETIASLKQFPGKISSQCQGYQIYWEGSAITVGDDNPGNKANGYQQQQFIEEKIISQTHSQNNDHSQSYQDYYLRGNTRDSNSQKSSRGSQDSPSKFCLQFAKKSSNQTPQSSDLCVNSSEVILSHANNLEDINQEQSQDKLRYSKNNQEQESHQDTKILQRSKSQDFCDFVKKMRKPLLIGLVGGLSGCIANINNFI